MCRQVLVDADDRRVDQEHMFALCVAFGAAASTAANIRP
nr:hypothetical protein JVH1_3249 [Rhodococcus sp. JVH1]